MITYTEKEAGQKICPQTFAVPMQQRSDGTIIVQSGPYNCIASNCMAWRVREGQGFCGLAGPPSRIP